MILNARLHTEQPLFSPSAILFIHGLFGSLDNLNGLMRRLRTNRQVIQVDVRNHGFSPHSNQMNYSLMAQDMLETLDAAGIKTFSVVGHSMGGKIAMMLSTLAPKRLERLIVLDISPVDYQARHHDAIFAAINAVTAAGVTRRPDAAAIMRKLHIEESIISFLLKSFATGIWRFNVQALWQNYATLNGWQTIAPNFVPALFIRGERSPYLDAKWHDALFTQFPQARLHTIADAGHWVHAEKPDAVSQAIHAFLTHCEK